MSRITLTCIHAECMELLLHLKLEEQVAAANQRKADKKLTSQLAVQKSRPSARREDLKSKFERGVIALNAVAPINQFSDDVLCYIFELLCEDSLPVTLPLTDQDWEPAPPQITLSHVCSAWREIMLDIPRFWRNIIIVPRNMDTPETIDTVVKAANTFLSRAKGLPCSIDIDFPEDNESRDVLRSLWEEDWHENIVRDLISLHKFKKLCVTFADHHFRDLLQLPDDNLSCVKDLCLRYISLAEDDTASPLGLHKLCNLTSFSLLPSPFDFYSLSDPLEGHFKFASIPWHNLRHIQLRATVPAHFCLDILEPCSALLETCSLAITGDHTSTSLPRRPVYLFQLRKLEVVAFSEEEILEFFLLSLRFPNLKSLTTSSSDYPIDLEMLLRVQNASQMQLEELIIPESTLDVDIDVRTLLMGFPTLRRFELPKDVTFTDEAMVEVGAGSIGVFLEHLTINESGHEFENLLQMVKARSHSGDGGDKQGIEATEFKSVTLHCDEAAEDLEDEVLYLIEEIKRSGVDLKVVFANQESEYGFNGDYSGASYDDEAIYGDFQLHIEY